MTSDYSNPTTTMVPVYPYPGELLRYNEPLEIIAQPCYTSKLRYRSDYDKNKNRRGVLRSRNNPNYQRPAIRIPQVYCDVTQQYYIRVSLVTVENEKTKCRYLHPYQLEDIDIDEHNDRQNNMVWFPIQEEDICGIKSFPSLRIVKKKADNLKDYGDFRVFDSPNLPSSPQLSYVKDTIKEYNLNKSQLAFTVGRKTIVDGMPTLISYSCTTILSDEMIEISRRGSDSDNAPTESTTVKSHSSKSSNCQMYKYAPRNGYPDSNDEILIFFTNKLKPRKYGGLQVTFEYDTPDNHWSEPVLDLEVRDQMVSFRTPNFPFNIDSCTTVNVILKQNKRELEPLKFDYVPIVQCPQCQRNATRYSNPNKRPISSLYEDDEQVDDATNIFENNPENQESNPELGTSSSSFRTMNPVCLTSNNEDASQQILDKLADGIASLFFNKNFIPVLRICRPFIRKRPELLHQAIHNNYSDLISNFILVADIELLQQKNQHGETVLLHAARLNRINIVKALLAKGNSDRLLKDINNKGQNIFHILALNTDSYEILDLLINHLLQKSINIQETFDSVDKDNHTPLQLAISNNNLSVTRHLLKYFYNDIDVTNNHITYDDNLTRIG